MPSRIFFFSDIDDTLMQTRRKTDFNKKTEVGAFNREGEKNSFFYEGTKVFIDTLLKSNITFVPTTARSVESYKRTTLAKEEAIKYVILNFGATILIDNKIDLYWDSYIKKEYKKVANIEDIFQNLNKILKEEKLDLVAKIMEGYYISIYNKYNLNNIEILNRVREILSDFAKKYENFYIYENDNSFAILPNFLNKKFAVKYLIEKYEPILTFGAGDNMSDLDFMNLTSFQVVPNNSAIHKTYKG